MPNNKPRSPLPQIDSRRHRQNDDRSLSRPSCPLLPTAGLPRLSSYSQSEGEMGVVAAGGGPDERGGLNASTLQTSKWDAVK